jgi:hypothetical protein
MLNRKKKGVYFLQFPSRWAKLNHRVYSTTPPSKNGNDFLALTYLVHTHAQQNIN